MCDACTSAKKSNRIGDKILLRQSDTVVIVGKTKNAYKVRYIRKNGTFYEYHTPR